MEESISLLVELHHPILNNILCGRINCSTKDGGWYSYCLLKILGEPLAAKLMSLLSDNY